MKIFLEMYKFADYSRKIIQDDPFGVIVITYDNPRFGNFVVFDARNRAPAGGGEILPKGADYELIEGLDSKSILKGFSFHGEHPIGANYELNMNLKEMVLCTVVNSAKYAQTSSIFINRKLMGMRELARRA
jgi:hypothetical protein